MATKEKKVSLGRRQQTASPSPKETFPIIETSTSDTQKSNIKATTVKLVKKITKNQPRKNQKKLSLKLKAKNKRKVPQKLPKSLKILEAKKLLKNGKVCQKKSKKEIDEDGPPVLEPIYPIEENFKKTRKRRVVRNPVAARKIKIEPEDPELYSDSSINSIKVFKRTRQIKIESIDTVTETIEGVISGFINPEDIKREPDSMSESSRSDIIKPKKLTKRQKLSLLQKEIKKENIENSITNIGPNDQKVIDMLDLNVLKIKKTYPKQKRRHTIEKYPLGSDEDFSQFNLFQSLPKQKDNTKTKRKVRTNFEGKVINPYTTRPPARLLRNGKQRKLKETLLDGLNNKKRKRLCSDFSGSEISKLSGYESDSSFSDLSSIHGADTKDMEIKNEQIENNSETNVTIKMDLQNLPNESQDYCMDTNSNVYVENQKKIDENVYNDDYPSESTKMPDKLLILDIMKQNFNENLGKSIDEPPELQDKPEPEPEKKMTEIISKLVETMGSEEFTATATDEGTALLMQNGGVVTTENMELEESNSVENSNELKVIDEDALLEDEEINDNDINGIENLSAEKENEILEGGTSNEETSQKNEEINESKDLLVDQNIVVFKEEQELNNVEVNEVQPTSKCDEQIVNNVNVSTENEEDLAIKENILKALGLQSTKLVEEIKLKEKLVTRSENYTGTLKTVIKLNRDSKKKGKNYPLKMTLQKNKSRGSDGNSSNQDDYKIMKEGSSSWKHGGHSSDTAGAHRKTHYSNRSNMDGSSEHTSDGEIQNSEGQIKALVIPEKASSFSIHPERLCKDECTYCFGKFGLFDTPCHIAQIKSLERQDKILSIETHLTRDSCLCDACYRHIDRKANTPSYVNKSFKRGPMIAPGPKENHCHVLGCKNVSTNVLRRKWIIKLKKQICEVINIDLDNPGLHSIPICDEHYVALGHLMVCALCKRRLAKNHIHYIGPEVIDLNVALESEGLPLKLSDKPVVCKLCRYYTSVLQLNPEERMEKYIKFLAEYKRRLLHFNNIVLMDQAEAEKPIIVPTKEKSEKEHSKKKRKLSKNYADDNSQPQSPVNEEKSTNSSSNEQNNGNSRPESPSDYLVDYKSLIPSIAMKCDDNEPIKKLPKLDNIKNNSETTNRDPNSELVVQRLGSNPSLSVRQLFPGEEELGLQALIDFNNIKETTPEGWEKCNLILQYDKETKLLWQELQKPYGNQSSFLRHLILLEKYFRNGDLELKPNASQQSINYSESVQNRLRAYDNIPTGASRSLNIINLQSTNTQKPCNKEIRQACIPGLPIFTSPNVSVTTVKQAPVTITQINNPLTSLIPVTITKTKQQPPPPGLISLVPRVNRPSVETLIKPAQKIKFPITKDWRPTLIPIDSSKPPTEKKTGLVQVISGGKPYHITLEDYKKMCAIKKSFELKQKKQIELQKRTAQLNSTGSSLLKTNKSLILPKIQVTKIEPNQNNENILEKLDQQVENLETKFHEGKALISLPKIPKSLTVIPQTIRKTSRSISPALLITQKSNTINVGNKS